ncbi:MAG: EamA family transporter [Gammaproteobacteria bacterium]|nr:EamA family transporter [Gammaproteobacteria bacterium]
MTPPNPSLSQSGTKPSLTYFHGVILVIMAGVFWSTMGIGIRLIEEANVWQILFYRSLSLSCFLFVVIGFRSKYQPIKTIAKSGIAGVAGGLGLVVAFSGGVYSIQTTTVANAMFLFASAPFFAAILGRILLREKVRTGTWIAIVIALTGIAIMVRQGISAGHLEGNVSALLSALGFAIFTIALRWKKLTDMLPAVFLAGVFTAAICALICMSKGYSFSLPTNDVAIAVSMGMFQVGLGLVIYTIGSTVVPAVELTLLSMTEVLLGPVWVWLFMSETVSTNTLIGGGIVLLAIVWNALTGLRRKPVPVL